MIFVDFGIFFAGWLVAQVVFRGYEAHIPVSKSILKLAILFVVFLAIHYFVGRWLFYSLLLIMAIAMGFLHVYWFHIRHGIHWRTAEPRDQYLRLIGR